MKPVNHDFASALWGLFVMHQGRVRSNSVRSRLGRSRSGAQLRPGLDAFLRLAILSENESVELCGSSLVHAGDDVLVGVGWNEWEWVPESFPNALDVHWSYPNLVVSSDRWC